MPKLTIADLALELIATERAVTTDQVVAAVLERKATRAKDPVKAVVRALENQPSLQRLSDGRWTSLLELLDGMVLTHELSAVEAAAGALAVDTDLGALWTLVGYGTTRLLLDGEADLERLYFSEAARRLGDRQYQRAFVLPDGLVGAPAGTFLHARVEGRMLTIAEGPRPTADARIAERRLGTAARTVVERMAGEPYDGVAGIHLVLADALLDAPDLLREPIAPLSEVLRSAGLEVFENLVGLPGSDWTDRGWVEYADLGIDDEEDDWDDVDLSDAADVGDVPDEPPSLAETLAEISERFDLDAREEKAVELFLVALQLEAAEAPIEDLETLQAFVRALQNPLIAEIIAAEAWQQASVGPFATRLLAAGEPGTTAGVRYVLAIDADADDDPDRAEEHLLAALAEDPAFVPALDALATLAEERGDLAEALRLLKRAGVPASDPGRAELERVLAPVGRKVGRNEPCPCGSGRKSKACHPDGVGAVALSGGRQLRWIVGVWSERPEVETGAHELLADAGFRPDHDVPEGDDEDTSDGDDRWRTAHGVATDIILYDDGDLADLLRSRGHRLPPDLLPLAGAWLRTERTLLEVRAITPDRGITVRDLLHDRLLTLEDPLLFRGIRLQELLCARPLPDGQGGHVVQSGFVVPRSDRERLIALLREGDGVALLEWLADH